MGKEYKSIEEELNSGVSELILPYGTVQGVGDVSDF